MKIRCPWAKEDSLLIEYHDNEWGIPVHDDNLLFEFLVLEGAQAGLSWITVLRKRQNYREAFDNFDPAKIASYNEEKIEELINNSGIIRNRRKIISTVTNAKAVLKIQEEFDSFDTYIWQFVGGKQVQNNWKTPADVPSFTIESQKMSLDLKKRGFKFVGPTICYAFMQAVGMVNDHIVDCFRYKKIKNEIKRNF
ncbi:DNA-3-methyladenine glycosylase I [Methanobacterium sp.]|uniref:DNA-3-methyladenine glycosylase I n=1 Tax=Methanobacterium sp. TaxID=2164 RepID=UPI003C7076C1